MSELKYPIGMQSFPEIRERGFVYVDKSQYIQQLHNAGKYFFLSRPRRFGKSLFLSMLHAYYDGRKELFKDLAIIDYEHDWKPAPVLHIDFTGENYTNPESLESTLQNLISNWEEEYDCELIGATLGTRFGNVIKAACKKCNEKVVILIDEYDKPLLDTVRYPELQDCFRNELRGIYGNLKKMDNYIQFAMLTGVTRFGKLSIFSDLNNLNDISMKEEFSGICGITPDELHRYFVSGVETLAEKNKQTVEQVYKDLKINYDGYHFNEQCNLDVYNPYSLLNALQNKKISDYWFGTGSPSHLVYLIKERQLRLEDIDGIEESASKIQNVSFDRTLIPMMYQSGYLTIKGYDSETDMLKLGFPNKEVEKGFLTNLMELYIPSEVEKSWTDIVAFYRDIKEGRVEDFMQRLQNMYADFNHDGFNFINLEQHYQDVAYLVFRLLGCLTNVKYKTSTGRIDMVISLPEYVYVFEFKRNSSAKKALQQINDNRYLLPFKANGRTLVKIGANFNDEIKGLDSWTIERSTQGN